MIMKMQKEDYMYGERMYTISYAIPIECADDRVNERNMWSLVNIEELPSSEEKLPQISRYPKHEENRCCCGQCGDWRVASFRTFYFCMVYLFIVTIFNTALFIEFMYFRISRAIKPNTNEDNMFSDNSIRKRQFAVKWFT